MFQTKRSKEADRVVLYHHVGNHRNHQTIHHLTAVNPAHAAVLVPYTNQNHDPEVDRFHGLGVVVDLVPDQDQEALLEPEHPALIHEPEHLVLGHQLEHRAHVRQPEHPAHDRQQERLVHVHKPEHPVRVPEPERPVLVHDPEHPARVHQPEHLAHFPDLVQDTARDRGRVHAPALEARVVGLALEAVVVVEVAAAVEVVPEAEAVAVHVVGGIANRGHAPDQVEDAVRVFLEAVADQVVLGHDREVDVAVEVYPVAVEVAHEDTVEAVHGQDHAHDPVAEEAVRADPKVAVEVVRQLFERNAPPF